MPAYLTWTSRSLPSCPPPSDRDTIVVQALAVVQTVNALALTRQDLTKALVEKTRKTKRIVIPMKTRNSFQRLWNMWA
jgi:hypothetical protein